ncbi:hypothetical protein [Paracoccus aestuariivivens]|uniref:hypothetical protein n=1 Tax=Paracoccus aestuariivivens TaxID=1820333 RepID=UPI001FE531CE|nr:hypothetical protein [Paracoccus aestuariivivens]
MRLTDRILMLFGFGGRDKQDLYVTTSDRMAALDDPATRKALAELPPHLLQDIGVSGSAPQRGGTQSVDGEVLRKYLW